MGREEGNEEGEWGGLGCVEFGESKGGVSVSEW